MARRFLNEKTHRFYFTTPGGDRASYLLIFGDEVKTLPGAAPSGARYGRIE